MEHKINIKFFPTSTFVNNPGALTLDGTNPAGYAIYSGDGNFGYMTGEGVSQTYYTNKTGTLPNGSFGFEARLFAHDATTKVTKSGELLFDRGFLNDFTSLFEPNTRTFYETGTSIVQGGTGFYSNAKGILKFTTDGGLSIGDGDPPGSKGNFGYAVSTYEYDLVIPSVNGIFSGTSAGRDDFIFNSPTEGISQIDKFTPGTDFIIIRRGAFGNLSFTGVGGSVVSDKLIDFVSGTTPVATTADPTLLYNTSSGALSFDLDGTGSAVATQFATLIGSPALSATDFKLADNAAPSSLNFNKPVYELTENTSTTGGLKVADIIITDDGLGTNTLSLSGADVTSFELRGNALFFIGTNLNVQTKAKYDVTVKVDDTTVGQTPDINTTFTLTIKNAPNKDITGTTPQFKQSGTVSSRGSLVYGLDTASGNVTTKADSMGLGQTNALFHNLVGLYQVENASGAIVDTLDVNGNGSKLDLLNPGDAGYARTAITNVVNNFVLQMGAKADPTKNTTSSQFGDVLLQGGKLYAPFAIANGGDLVPIGGTLKDGFKAFVDKNPNNTAATLSNFMTQAVAYFSFGSANPDGTEHLQNRGNNVFGFEDLPGNLGISDFDFNDAVFKFSFLT